MLALGIAACETTQTTSTATAVMCGKCQSVWIKTAEPAANGNKGFIAFQNEKVMKCADCENAVITFFRTGDLKHKCGRCGSTLEHCTQH